MLKEQEQFQMHIQLLKMNMQEEKVMMYLKKKIIIILYVGILFLPFVEISTAQRVLSFAIGCFIRSLTTIGVLFDVREGFGYLNKIFFN
jgi:hypothetical protein